MLPVFGDLVIEILRPSEIELMREAGKRAALTLRRVTDLIKPGTLTAEIDQFVRFDCTRQDCIPAPLGYRGSDGRSRPFPAACCTSINEVVCHGIPSASRLKDGDIINVDVTHIYKGYHGDTSATFYVGTPSDEARRLVEACRRSLELGIAEVRPGARIGDVGAAIEEYARSQAVSVVTDFVGHGIGRRFHTDPRVPHCGIRGLGIRLKPGMCFTIEPMLNLGHPQTKLLHDGWTAVTVDGSWSAQFEHTILVTDDGHEVLTNDPTKV